MKANFLKSTLVLVTFAMYLSSAFAQSPNGISYQAVVRNSSDDLATNTNIGMQISILQGSAGGTAVYVERHFPTTNANGLVSFEIGSGTIISGNFEVIDWENGPYFIKTETDLNGGSNYTITGTSEFLSVPYALHSKTAETVSGGISENDPVFSAWDKDYNDLINTPAIPVIPENVSEFTNDAGYITEYTELDPEFSAWDKDYNDLINTPSIPVIPENVSDFTNDAGYLTEYTELDPEFSAWDKDYNDLINTPAIPVIPENVSDFTNDAGYLTEYTELDPEFSANFDFSDATVGDLLQFDGTKWVKVTPDYISDYTVTESDVTAHEGALTITESQISDLGTYIEIETQNLDDVLTQNNSAGNKNITNLADPLDAQDAVTKAYVDELKIMILDLQAESGVTDARDGYHYDAVRIGNQVWMAENLKYLPSVVGPSSNSQTIPYYYVYGYNGTDVNIAKETSNFANYGVLYNWSAAMSGYSSSMENPSNVQGICPTGWHLPSEAEWVELRDYLGGETVAGSMLKEIGTTHWFPPNISVTNSTGFTALPGGVCAGYEFYSVTVYGVWSCASEISSNSSYNMRLEYDNIGFYLDYSEKDSGLSVRCVKD